MYYIIKNHLKKTLNINFFKKKKKVAIAYSGGIDSSVLLNIIYKLNLNKKLNIFIIYINHNINKNFFFLKKKLKKNLKKYKYLRIKIIKIKKNKDNNLEKKLRDQRYLKILNYCKKNNIKYVLLAHHKLDLIENIFLNILRGCNLFNIINIKNINILNNIKIIRPFLNLSKIYIKKYSKIYKIKFINDKTNYNIYYKRNILRNKIIPFILNYFPNFIKKLNNLKKNIFFYKKLFKILYKKNYNKNIFNENIYINKINLIKNNLEINNLIFYYLKKNNFLIYSLK